MKAKIINYELDMENFGGVLVDVEINGKTMNLGEQLVEDDGEYRREYSWEPASCWSFINGNPVDDGSASFTEIDAEEGQEIFDSVIDDAIELVNLSEDELIALQTVLEDCTGDTDNLIDYFLGGEILTLNTCRSGQQVAWCVWSESNESCRYVDNLKPLSAAEIEEQLL